MARVQRLTISLCPQNLLSDRVPQRECKVATVAVANKRQRLDCCTERDPCAINRRDALNANECEGFLPITIPRAFRPTRLPGSLVAMRRFEGAGNCGTLQGWSR